MINNHSKYRSLFILFSLLFLVFSETSFAQRNFDEESIVKYKKEKVYDYFKQKQLDPKKESTDSVDHSNSNSVPILGDSVKIVLIILFVGILIFIIYSIVSNNKGYKSYSSKKTGTHIIEKELDEEQIEENDFDNLIKSALSKEEYRSALRLMFLKSLQILNQKEIIRYKKNKTNFEYLSEIKVLEIKTVFQKASEIFSWVWYANNHDSINKETFIILETHFKSLLKEIE